MTSWHIVYRDTAVEDTVTAARIYPSEGFVAFFGEDALGAEPFLIINADVIRTLTAVEA